MREHLLFSANQKSIFIGIFAILLIMFVGVAGYMSIENYSFLDALYMVIITIATVGYREVEPLSDGGKLFTIFMITSSIGIFGYAITSFSKLMLDGYIRQKFKDYNVKKRIDKLQDHVIICGYGRNGFQACEELADHNESFIIVEKRDHVVDRIRENPERLFVQGDASSEEILSQAQIHKAKALITALPNDADNIYVVLTAREMNPHLKIISRASDFRTDTKLKRAGANNVIMPDLIGGQRMAKLVAQADVVEFIELIISQKKKIVSVENLFLKELTEEYEGQTIRDLEIQEQSGVNIMGIKNESGNYLFNPSPDTPLSRQMQLFVMGTPEQLMLLKSLLKIK